MISPRPTRPPVGVPPPLRKNRDFVLLWLGLAASLLGSRISAIAYPLLVLALHYSPADAGLAGFLATLPYLILQLPAGALIDRWNRKRTMIACDVGRCLALTSIVVALVMHRITLAQVMIAAFVEGSCSSSTTLLKPRLCAIVPSEQLPAALAQNEARNRGAAFAGQPLGGFFFGLGRSVPFLADAVSYLVSISTLMLIRTEFQADRSPAPFRRLLREIREGIVWLWRQPFLRATSLLVAGSNFVFQALVLVLIVIARDRGASSTVIGVMLAGAGIGRLLGALAAPWLQKRLRASIVVIGANWAWAVLIVPIAFIPDPYALGGIFALMAFIGPTWNVVIGAYQLTITPEPLLGRVASADMLVGYGAIPLGSLTAGFLLDSIGAQAATLVLSVVVLGCALAASASRGLRAHGQAHGTPDIGITKVRASAKPALTPPNSETLGHIMPDRVRNGHEAATRGWRPDRLRALSPSQAPARPGDQSANDRHHAEPDCLFPAPGS